MLQIIAAGRLTKDAETRTTQGGDSVTGFSVAVNVGYGDKKHPIFLECSMWGKRGTSLAPYLLKGASVTVIGEADLRKWESNNGSGTSLTCMVAEITLQGGKHENSSGGAAPNGKSGGGGGGNDWTPPADMDDEIPFITNTGVW